MSQMDSLISKLLKQNQIEKDGINQQLNEFAMDIEFPHTKEEQHEE
ncbi:MAG TPA: hypothetical protein VJ824_03525 [Bacillota bacterium]|nr:hypothetical protein [Bacillota bacterium]